MPSFVLTYNPQTWDWDTAEVPRAEFVAETAEGRVVQGRWSTGSRSGGLSPGDTAYLFRQGRGPRGLVGAGRFTSEVYVDEHFTDPGRTAHYASVEWLTVLDDEQVLPLDDVRQVAPGAPSSRMQGSGVRLSDSDAEAVERLWAQHLTNLGRGAWPGGEAGRQLDALQRRAVEDYAQALLEQYYRDRGWAVTDTRYGNPYDAVATRGGHTLFL